jgi:hypothetical protein
MQNDALADRSKHARWRDEYRSADLVPDNAENEQPPKGAKFKFMDMPRSFGRAHQPPHADQSGNVYKSTTE